MRTNALTGGWAPYATNLAAITPMNVYTGSMGSATQLLFRVRVRP